MPTTKYPLLKEIQLLGKLLQAEFATGTARARRICEVWDFLLLTERTRYLNFGYWVDGCEVVDDACEAMVDLVGRAAELKPGDRVLDAGFGYGEQDLRWLETTGVAEIVGVNITPVHVREARRLAQAKGVGDRVKFLEGSATELTFGPETFDKVVSIEALVQFAPRQKFLEHAFRVLRPGGIFAVSDIIPLAAQEGQASTVAKRKWEQDGFFNGTSKENWYPAEEYSRRLTALGFTDVTIRSIRDDVWEPWRRYMVSRIDDPVFKARISRMIYPTYRKYLLDEVGQRVAGQPMAQADYVLVVARKPGR
ncbi:methyltransferase domain-containing protein [Amycolatopsis sp. A133]|jgi:erythromycin 3''-O-methyltransferase|uniref:SAM-dependent methyltransferase n=1 Tax=Amycolatopsis sp. A133 TaxID=3064472 RepID=UPI0027E9F596|nr:methyltransferase domain-containing protein [Amycolatopsis sp. A133]MDQ7807607.1 methyltransferase domain-containing protein [Amycolatopsis sp. A133]